MEQLATKEAESELRIKIIKSLKIPLLKKAFTGRDNVINPGTPHEDTVTGKTYLTVCELVNELDTFDLTELKKIDAHLNE
tara:strand:+ start:2753 stop:2992 length:240 start_codon:yes stop_codon:yes gene_type:complete